MRYILLITLAAAISSCNTTLTAPDDRPPVRAGLPATDSATVHNLFQQCYEHYSADSSERHLDSLFTLWQKTFASNEDSCSLTPHEKNLIDLYRVAYQPTGFPAEIGSEWGDLYSSVEYLVVDCNFRYVIVSFDPSESDSTVFYGITDSSSIVVMNSIPPVRPELSLAKPHLYLDDGLEAGIQAFLGDQYTSVGATSIMDPATAAEETARRAAFLSSKIRMMHYHWLNGFHIASHPEITQIIMNEDGNAAVLYFTLIYQGGYMIAKKINGTWHLTEAELTWIT